MTPREAAEHSAAFILQEECQYKSRPYERRCFLENDSFVVQTNFKGPARQEDLDWLKASLEEGLGSGRKSVVLRSNDFLFLPIMDVSFSKTFIEIIGLLLNRSMHFRVELDGEFNGEGNLLLECADEVTSAPGTINFPFSEVRNFMSFGQDSLRLPFFDRRFEQG